MTAKSVFMKKYLILSIFSIIILSGCGQKPQTIFVHNFLKPPGNVIVALFDSSEKRTTENNEIKKFLEKNLEILGFKVRYHDINRGLPSGRLMRNARGIVTWFKDSSMRKAESYCAWLAKQIESGKDVIIFDNFGAYQDSKTKKWTPMRAVNSVFRQLGVQYRAQWTSDSELLQVAHKDSEVVEKKVPIDLSKKGYYYLFEKVDDNLRPYLTIHRKDLEQSESCIIFSHPNGGMALSRYIVTVDKSTGKEIPNIAFSRFLKESLFPGADRTQIVLIIWDEDKDCNEDYIKNLIKTLEYAKIEFDIIRFNNLKKLLMGDLQKYSTLALYTDNLWTIKDKKTLDAIKGYVDAGGGILVAYRCINKSLLDVFGVKEVYEFYDKSLEGLDVTASFFPGSEHLFYLGAALEHHALNVDLKKDADVLAVALEKNSKYPQGIPIAWLNKYGKGRVVFWNSNCMSIVTLRGLLLQSLLLTQPVSVFSLAGIENIHIDDFPRPSYNTHQEPVKDNYGMTDTEFYLNIWWKDILDLARKYNVKYTCYAIFNYDEKTTPPFKSREFEYGKNNAFIEFTKRIINNNFEIGLHGYNHQSLTLKPIDYTGWRKKKYMVQALKQAKKLWQEIFPETEMPFSYVAPMNVIEPTGKKVLHDVFPTIKVVSKLLAEKDDAVRSQEFGSDPDVPHFFNIPRVSAGYMFDQTTKNNLINAINTFGIWTHFIHPDDVFGRYALGSEGTSEYQEETIDARNWKMLLTSAHSMFNFIRESYPWLRDMSTRDTYYELVKYFNRRSKTEIKKNIVTVSFPSGTSDKKYFGLKINDKRNISKTENCTLIHSYPDLNTHIFETESSRVKIELKGI